jgi:osmotically-inducible protein OsmY
MTVRNWIAACALSALTVVPAAAQTTAAKVDDAAIKSRVETRLKSADSLKSDHIVVSVDNGVVTLKGKVHSESQSTQAAELAKVAGVTTVENKLDVDTKDTMDKAEAKTKNTAEKTKDATVKGAEKTGEKTKDVAGTTGEVVTDAWITTEINTKFVNEDTLKGSDINVDTDNHVVTLKGTVASAAGKTRAEEIAKKTKGVHRVVNTLTIGAKK